MGAFDLPRRRDTPTSPLVAGVVSVPVAAMGAMQSQATDNHPLPHRWPNLRPLTGLSAGQIRTVYALALHRLPARSGRPWCLPLPVRVLLVLVHLRTNHTTRLVVGLRAYSRQSALAHQRQADVGDLPAGRQPGRAPERLPASGAASVGNLRRRRRQPAARVVDPGAAQPVAGAVSAGGWFVVAS